MPELLNYLVWLASLAILILGFAFIIFVHELGHFLVAKWVGIKVSQFALGFGPALIAWRKGIGARRGTTEPEVRRRVYALLSDEEKQRVEGGDPDQVISPRRFDELRDKLGIGETEYRLNYLPLGGYVKMLGQDDMDPTATSEDPRAFNRKPVWARACVVSAGVVMNLIFAVLFFIVAFSMGVAFPPAIVGDVVPDFPAATTYARGHDNDPRFMGLQPGDRITHMNGKVVDDFIDIRVNTALARKDARLELAVERGDQQLTYVIVPKPDNQEKLLALGIVPEFSLELDRGATLSDELTSKGVTSDMRITRVAGKPITHHYQLRAAVLAARGAPVPVTFTRTGKEPADVTVELRAYPGLTPDPDDSPANRHLLGMVPTSGAVLEIQEGSPAKAAGLQVGDLIARIGDVEWPSAREIEINVKAKPRRPLALSVYRGGQIIDLKPVTPASAGMIGIRFDPYAQVPIIRRTLPDSPAASLNLPAGSRIVSVNGQTIADTAQLQRVLMELTGEGALGGAIEIGYELRIKGLPRGQATVEFTQEDVKLLAEAKWLAPPLPLAQLTERVSASDPWSATVVGIQKTHQFMLQTYVTLLRLVQGSVHMDNMRGPVGIAQAGTSVMKEQGLAYLLFFFGLISVNLVVVNFLPMPIVDGGLMVFLIIEKLKGSPVSAKIQGIASVVGLVLIAGVFLFTFYYDVARLLKM